MNAHPSQNSIDLNQGSLRKLLWAIEADRGKFSLIFSHCNSVRVRRTLMQQLEESSDFEITKISLQRESKVLYTEITQTLPEIPQVGMVWGFEKVECLEELLKSAKRMRESFRNHFPFPLILWVTDEVLSQMIRHARDFYSWGTTVEFEVSPAQFLEFIEEVTEEVFTQVLALGANRFLDNTVFDLQPDSPRFLELQLAQKSLKAQNISLDPILEASLEFVLGRVSVVAEESKIHDHKSLTLWQKNLVNDQSKIRYGIVLIYLGLWYRISATEHRLYYQDYCQQARDYFQQGITQFEQVNRSDLVAKFINPLGEVLQRLEQWEDLETIAQKALNLHQNISDFLRLSHDYRFLAELALARSKGQEAKQYAEKALNFLEKALKQQEYSQEFYQVWTKQYYQGFYLFSLGKAHLLLGETQEAIQTLEKACQVANPKHEPVIYLEILEQLRNLYFQGENYQAAFQIKQQQRAIKHQFGFRAFIGAGRLQPQQMVTHPTLSQIEQPDSLAQEITASGRKPDVDNLVNRLSSSASPLTIIYGISGVGKSSIIQAGLIPTLNKKTVDTRQFIPVLQRVYTQWHQELAQALTQVLEEKRYFPQETIQLSSPESILEQLQKNEKRNLRTILIFDQFEEFFFVCQEISQRKSFYQFIKQCLEIQQLRIIFSLREDYIHYLLEIPRLLTLDPVKDNIISDILDRDNLYYLGNFNPEQAKSIIQYLTKQTDFYLEDNLVEELVKDLGGTTQTIRPIELQIVGEQLQTENITNLIEYNQFGNKRKLVESFLEEVIHDCGSINNKIARSVLYLLTDDNGTRPLKTHEELRTFLKVEPEQLNLILEIFIGSGLVILLKQLPADLYQLIHDYLVNFIRQQNQSQLIEDLNQERKSRQLAEEKLEREQEKNRLAELEIKLAGEEQDNLRIKKELADKERQLAKTKLNRFFKIAVPVVAILATANGILAVKATISENNETLNASINKSEKTFWQGKQFDALIAQLKIAEEIEHSEFIDKIKNFKFGVRDETKFSLILALQKTLYNVKEKNRFHHKGAVNSVDVSPDGSLIVSASNDGTVKLWNREGELIPKFSDNTQDKKYNANTVQFSPDGRTIAFAGTDSLINILNIDGTSRQEIESDINKEIHSLNYSSDGKFIAVAGYKKIEILNVGDHLIEIWNLDGSLKKRWKDNLSVKKMIFHPDGKHIVSASLDRSIKLWAIDGQLVKEIQAPSETEPSINDIAFSPDGKVLASAHGNKTIKLWKLDQQTPNFEPQSFFAHDHEVLSVTFSSDGQQLASTGKDGTVKIWDLDENLDVNLIQTLTGHLYGVNSISFSPDDRTIISASDDYTVRLWDLEGIELKNFTVSNENITSIHFKPGSETLAFADSKGNINFLQDNEIIEYIRNENQDSQRIYFSFDGEILASANRDGLVKLWDKNKNKIEVFQLSEENGNLVDLTSFTFVYKTQMIISGHSDGTIKFWNFDEELLHSFPAHNQHDVTDIEISPNGQILASASHNSTIKIWKMNSNFKVNFESQKILAGHQDIVSSLSFSPNGKILASGSWDDTVKLWNQEGQELTSWRVNHSVTGVSFSPDGKKLVAASRNGRLIWWNLDLGDLSQKGCEWIEDYLETNPNVKEDDQNICSD